MTLLCSRARINWPGPPDIGEVQVTQDTSNCNKSRERARLLSVNNPTCLDFFERSEARFTALGQARNFTLTRPIAPRTGILEP
jgi:hypothetical protein